MRGLAMLVVVSAACANGAKHDGDPDPPMPTTTPSPSPAPPSSKVVLTTPAGDATVNVEVVASRQKIMKGLMYREHLPLDAGMLFLMGYEEDHHFWMKNTLISLDMIFITKDMKVAGFVERAVPRSEKLVNCGAVSYYVLEVNAGWVAAHKLPKGAPVRFENVQN